ncbi:DUF4118 domain-containing protein [Bradyrhizobium iriomotense]|uniref:DUF4118 domain-containing protein n=1 Tax=Bradyrhizobium iriomotense TaxID=441950 RepID=A0ABQ6AW27_9BRAD|nr:DUF4118 domain-containing protein [Bradyrhizobium iriomotense]GLR86399.1 DUF4118 domain-containing protein [Bradyrhizobium iriomotense]
MSRPETFAGPKIRPWSWQAFAFAFIVLATSAGFQGVCVLFGAQLYFAAFLPAVFVVGIVAGAPAAVLAVLLTVPLVWWAFMPPFFEFSPLTRADAHDINLFFLFSVLLIGLADLCRQTMTIINGGGLEATDKTVAPNSQ